MLLLTNYCRVTILRQLRTRSAPLLLSPLPGSLADAFIKPGLPPARQRSQLSFLCSDPFFPPLNRSSLARLSFALLRELLVRHVEWFNRPQRQPLTLYIGQPHAFP